MMRPLLFLFIFLPILLFSQSPIDKEIDAIKNAPIKKRYELMNRLKEKLIKMRREEQLKAIKKLQKFSQSGKSGKKTPKEQNRTRPNASLPPEEIIQEHIESKAQRYFSPTDTINEREGHGSF